MLAEATFDTALNIYSRSVYLGGNLSLERTATMCTSTTMSVGYDLPPCKASITLWTAKGELA